MYCRKNCVLQHFVKRRRINRGSICLCACVYVYKSVCSHAVTTPLNYTSTIGLARTPVSTLLKNLHLSFLEQPILKYCLTSLISDLSYATKEPECEQHKSYFEFP